MKRKERTPEEKHVDLLTKRAIMQDWARNPLHEAATPNPFPYVLFWDRLGRKGQRCRIVKLGLRIVTVEFESDGFKHTINKMALRRAI